MKLKQTAVITSIAAGLLGLAAFAPMANASSLDNGKFCVKAVNVTDKKFEGVKGFATCGDSTSNPDDNGGGGNGGGGSNGDNGGDNGGGNSDGGGDNGGGSNGEDEECTIDFYEANDAVQAKLNDRFFDEFEGAMDRAVANTLNEAVDANVLTHSTFTFATGKGVGSPNSLDCNDKTLTDSVAVAKRLTVGSNHLVRVDLQTLTGSYFSYYIDVKFTADGVVVDPDATVLERSDLEDFSNAQFDATQAAVTSINSKIGANAQAEFDALLASIVN